MWIAVAWMALLSLASICSASPALAQEDIAQQIRQLASPGRAEVLGAKLLRQSRSPAAEVATVWQTGDPAVRRNARLVLNEMEEAALDPLLKAKGNLDPMEQVWRMTMVVETIGELRKSAAAMLDRELSNKQTAALPSMVGAEDSEPGRRVCDEAYVQMSRLLAANPESEAFVLKMHQFRRMPDAGRDAEIQRARQSAAWRSLSR